MVATVRPAQRTPRIVHSQESLIDSGCSTSIAPGSPFVQRLLSNLRDASMKFTLGDGNAKVEASGHAFAKVKFGEFTKEGYDAWRKKGGKPPNMEGRSANLWR